MSGKIAIPNQVGINVSWSDGPNSHPLVASLQSPGQVQMQAFGGMHKVEEIAGQIAASLAFIPTEPCDHEALRKIPALAVDLAEEILAECRFRREEAANKAEAQEKRLEADRSGKESPIAMP